MTELTHDEVDAPQDGASRFSNFKGAASTALGAFVALALLLTLGVWFYRLGVRDAQNIPIIRAALEPAKVRPDDPGGAVTPHQEITSYEVAESEPSSSVAAVIAPSPAAPRREDVAMGTLPSSEEAPQPKPVIRSTTPETPAVEEPSTDTQTAQSEPVEPQTDAIPSAETSTPVESDPGDEIDRLVAQATDTDETAPSPDANADTSGDGDGEQLALATTETSEEAQAQQEQEPEPQEPAGVGTEQAPASSPNAPRRPANLLARVREAAVEESQSEGNLAKLAAASAVQVQLAADPVESNVRQQWQRIYKANTDILRDRALAVQTTVSGGTTFYRLRVGPFKDRSEARAVCQALKARGQDCIVARNS